jgi:hypothetical protein
MRQCHVIQCVDANHASFKYLAGCRNKTNKNDYPNDDTEIVFDDMTTPTQAKLAHLVVMVAGLGLKSAQRRKFRLVRRNIASFNTVQSFHLYS